MARQADSELTISCLQCEWSVDATNTSVQASTAFLEAAYAHVDAHEQHALEIVQRLRCTARTMWSQSRLPQMREMLRPGGILVCRVVCWTGEAGSTDYHLIGEIAS